MTFQLMTKNRDNKLYVHDYLNMYDSPLQHHVVDLLMRYVTFTSDKMTLYITCLTM